uniref:Rhamnogalacturonan endolyase n=1 Tax=Kalanchoe fedtschenkoi TaxID=63787 RepID=A0A7N0T548_KALFE
MNIRYRLSGTIYSVIKQTDDQVELSFRFKSDARSSNNAPFDFDKRLVSAGGYQFWFQADRRGRFVIKNVVPGTYNLYAWVPGFLGDFKHNSIVTIAPGGNVNLGRITFEPPRDGPTLWEIGIPDRNAAEFYIPDPSLIKYNHYRFVEKFREYGLWERYSELYPKQDLTFTINRSKYQKDWFFAQVTRKGPNQTYLPTTWKIEFNLPGAPGTGIYKLRIAIASATLAEVQVRINDPASPPHFSTGLIGRDNTVARHGSHGLYWLFHVDVPGAELVKGSNAIYLTQSRNHGPFVNVMYDYIRLERPA